MIHQQRVQKTFCTTREAARILGVSLRTAQLWAEGGLLEAWKTKGGHRRIARDSINRLLTNPAARSSGNIELEDEHPPARLAPVADQPALAAQAAPLSILVVEDEASLRRLYEVKIGHWPMPAEVSVAADGYEALIRMGHARPDLLITDLRMPGMDGFRMLQAIRRVAELADMSIVVVTGLGSAEVEGSGGVPPGILVLPKPIPFDRLQALAERILAEKTIAAGART